MSRADDLVDADRVRAHPNDPTVLDVDEGVSPDDTGHLAGAALLHWATELQQAGVPGIRWKRDGANA